MQEGFTYRLNDILELAMEGKYYEAIEEADKVLKKKDTSAEEEIEAMIWKSRSLFLLSIFEVRDEYRKEALELSEKAFKMSEELENSLLMFNSLIIKTWSLSLFNRSKEVIEEVQRLEEIYLLLEKEYPTVSNENKAYLLRFRNSKLIHEIRLDENLEWDFKVSLEYLKEAIELVSKVNLKGSILTSSIHQWSLINIAQVYSSLGKYDEAIKYRKEALKIAEKNKDPYWTGSINLAIGNEYWMKGEYDLQFEFIQKYKEIIEKIGNERCLGAYHHRLGVYFGEIGNWKKCLEHTQKGFEILSENGKREDHNDMLNNLGVTYFQMGEYDKALEFYEKTIEWHEKKGNQYGLHFIIVNMAASYREKGNLDKALEMHERSNKYFRRSGNKIEYANSLFSTGFTYLRKGLLNKALESMKNALAIFEEIGNTRYVISILTNMVGLAIDFFEKPDLAKEFYQELERRSEDVEYEVSKNDILIAEAVILKKSSNQRERVKAELILDKLLVELPNYPAQIYALFHMCDLLLFEMKISSDEAVLNKLQKYVTILIEKASKNNLPAFIIEGLWFKSQLSLLILDFDKARELLTQALNIAEDRGLNQQVLKITKSKEELTQQIIRLNDLEPTKPTIAQRMDTIKIENGFREIKTSEKLFSLKI